MTQVTGAASHNQRAMWLHHQQLEDSSVLHNAVALQFDGTVSAASVKLAFAAILARHEALSMSFRESNGDLQLTIQDMSDRYFGVLNTETVADAISLANREVRRNLRLDADPLFNVRVIQIRGCTPVVVFWAHHIVTDAYSFDLLKSELQRGLSSDDRLHGDLGVGTRGLFTEHCARDAAVGKDPDAAASMRFWTSYLNPELPATRLYPSYRRAASGYQAASHLMSLPGEVCALIDRAARDTNSTVYSFLLALFIATIARFSGQDCLSLGLFALNRKQHRAERVIGYYSNPLPLQISLPREASFRSFIRQVLNTVLTLQQHEAIPFSLLVEKLNPLRHGIDNPFFGIVFDSLLRPQPPTQPPPGQKAASREFSLGVGGGAFDWLIWLSRSPSGQYVLDSRYNAGVYAAWQIEQVMHCFADLCQLAAASPDRMVASTPVITGTLRKQIIETWNDTEAAIPHGTDLLTRVAQFASDSGNHLAIVFCDKRLTYSQLEGYVTILANGLRRYGVSVGDPVALNVRKSIYFVPLVLAIWKLGAVYVPVDPDYPAERIATIVRGCGARFAVVDQVSSASGWDTTIMAVDSLLTESAHGQPEASYRCEARAPDELAYLMHTSGSTGMPKGVEIKHSSLINLLVHFERQLHCGRGDTTLCLGSISFDISILELFLPLFTGGTLVLAQTGIAAHATRLAKLIADAHVTIVSATPMTWRLLAQASNQLLRPVRVALCGGDSFDLSLVRDIQCFCNCVYNVYGPTEATVWATATLLPPGCQRLTIGRPIGNTRVYILNESLEPVPIGMQGEIYIAGAGVAAGYCGNEELTTARFPRDPFFAGTMYRTGDWGYFEPDGTIVFIGRTDNQVKLRGYRIELGEIENLLRSIPEVKNALVFAPQDASADGGLVAFIVPRTPGAVSMPVIEAQLSNLPHYMRAIEVVESQSLPLTVNNKLDRSQLPALYAATRARPVAGQWPTTADDAEQLIRRIWESVLGAPVTNRDANFFDLGGTSMKVNAVRLRLEREHGLRVSLFDLFVNTTVKKLSGLVRSQL